MFKSVVGHSEDIELNDALADVISQCRSKLGDSPASAGFLFCWVGHDLPTVAQAIYTAFPGIQLIGATTDGELSSELVFSDTSIALQILSSDEIQFRATVARDAHEDTEARVAAAARQALGSLGHEARLCITFPESITLSGSAVVRALRGVLGETFPIFGGTAGDARRVEKTFQFFGGEVLTNSVPLMLISDPICFSSGRFSGWEPLDLAGTVTRAEGNVVHEINNRPAVEFFSRYLGNLHEVAGKYAEYPLIIEGGADSYQISVLSVDLTNNS
ncbi:MAG: hypothetical protein KC561_04430, partial [Myxococcales bacterium]|nr:hypothetical protein [Myxococcales bacterium]